MLNNFQVLILKNVHYFFSIRHIEVAQIGGLTKGAFGGDNHNNGTNLPIEDFAQEDRERTLELLLSQERVVTLLYSKVFPMVGGGGGKGNKGGVQGGPNGALDNLIPMDEEEVASTVGLLNVNGMGEDETAD